MTTPNVSFEDDSEEEMSAVELAPPPPPPNKRKAEDYEKDQLQRKNKIKQLKTMRINHPDLKIGLTAEMDKEFACMTEDELDNLVDNYHLELTAARPFATGVAAATIIGRLGENFMGLGGFSTRLTGDTHFVANLDQCLPQVLSDYGPQLRTGFAFITHVVNAIGEDRQWQAPPMQLPKSDTPVASSS